MSTAKYKAGYVAIIGKPNVGKSTLLNHLVGRKVSITSSKPQTTRFPILGIVTNDDAQFVFVDTPGYQTEHSNKMNQVMNRAVMNTLAGVDIIVFVIDAMKFDQLDKKLFDLIPNNIPLVFAINKVDKLRDKSSLLPLMDDLNKSFNPRAIIPISGEKGTNLSLLLQQVANELPKQEAIFEESEYTNQSDELLASEIIREKIFRLLGDEIPYSTIVIVDHFVREKGLYRIRATILVEKPGQKAIVIGENGAKLKTIGSQARRELEQLFGTKVFLETWVKVKKGWTDDLRIVNNAGLTH